MIVRQYAPCNLGRNTICLGKQGEINALRVEFDVSAWMAMYPDATVKLMHFAPDRPQDIPVIPTLGVEGTTRVWIVGEDDTANAGNGVIELLLIDERTGSTIKSATGYTTVLHSPSAGIEAQEAEAGYVRYDVDQSALLTDEQKAVARKNIGAGTGDGTGGGTGGITQETDPTVPAWAKQPNKPTYTAGEVGARPDTWMPSASDVGADAAGTAAAQVNTHNVSGEAHADLRALIDGLTSRLNALADSDDETLDQLSEIVAYIKSNKALIDAVTTGKVSTSDIVDNLTTNASGKVLSAAQGVALKAMIDGIVIPTALPNPQPITINGQRYDGSEAVTVTVSSEGSGTPVEIDDTLTQSGKAADAKAVGDRLNELNEANVKQDDRLKALESSGMGLLTSPDGTRWVLSVSDAGVITATRYTEEGETLDTYTIFVPDGVSNEWDTGGTGSSTAAKTLNISADAFVELFYDSFVSAPPAGLTVTKTSIGKDQTGTYDMWEYDFKPDNYDRTILLSSGMHTYELSASFGLANFIGNLYSIEGNEAFEYIRNKVRIKVIPVVNPWGFNQSPKKYGNYNGVNPNRNFDFNGAWAAYPVYTPDQNEWNVKGDAPFSEAEVRNLANWALDNTDAEFWIDCHTGLGYDQYDNWIIYQSDSKIRTGIETALARLETWFNLTYGIASRTNAVMDSADSIRTIWSEKCAGIPSFTVEQAPGNTIFGTANNNDAGDISNYSTCVSTYVQELLLEKYRSYAKVAVTGISVSDVSMTATDASKTVTATLTPSDTTQTRFVWASDNPAVCEVYGGSDKGVIVNKGEGTANITVTSAEDASVKTSFTVTIAAEQEEGPSEPTVGVTFSIGAVDSTTGAVKENTARLVSDLIAVDPPCNLTITSNDGYYVKAFGYASDSFLGSAGVAGGLTAATASGRINFACDSIRIVLKKSNDSDFTEAEAASASVTIETVSLIVEGTTLNMELGSFSNGDEISSTTRCRSKKYIPVDASKDIQVSPSLANFYFNFKAFDKNLGFVSNIRPDNSESSDREYIGENEDLILGWCQGDGYIDVSKSNLSKAKYLRMVVRRTDDGTITLPISGTITIGGVTYTLA